MNLADAYAQDLANRALGRQKVRDLMLKLHIKQNQRTHPPVFDPRCAECLRLVRGEPTAGNTNGKANEKGAKTMNETKSVWASKTVWLAILTMVLGVLEQMKALPLDPKFSGYLTMIVAVLTFVVRMFTSGPVAVFKK